LLGLLLAALASFGCIGSKQFPIKGVGLAKCEVNQSYTEQVPYTLEEYHTEEVPYSAVEYYMEQSYEVLEQYTEKECTTVPYTSRECTQEELTYETKENCYFSGWLQNWTNVKCTITNTGSESGFFNIYAGLIFIGTSSPPKGKWLKTSSIGENETVYLSPRSSKTLTYSQSFKQSDDMKNYRCYCYAQSVSKKETCGDVESLREECRDVTKHRTVTKYKPVAEQTSLNGVTKNKTVTRYRNETKVINVTKYREETRYKTIEEDC
jgi:hypothetical protein